MNQWMKEPGIIVIRTVYHGLASFIGNQAERLLSKVDLLEIKLKKTVKSPDKLSLAKLLIKALKQFNDVTHSCFGQNLLPNYPEHIIEFMETYRALNITIPVKVHLLETHAIEFLKIMGRNMALASTLNKPWSQCTMIFWKNGEVRRLMRVIQDMERN